MHKLKIVLRFLEGFIANKIKGLHLLVTGCRDNEIESGLSGKVGAEVETKSSNLEKDIRLKATNSRNIISGWLKSGLRPFNPEQVLKYVQKPEEVKYCSPLDVNSTGDDVLRHIETPETPKTFENLILLRKNVKISLTRQEVVDTFTKLSIQKIADAAENAFAERAILLDENMLLF